MGFVSKAAPLIGAAAGYALAPATGGLSVLASTALGASLGSAAGGLMSKPKMPSVAAVAPPPSTMSADSSKATQTASPAAAPATQALGGAAGGAARKAAGTATAGGSTNATGPQGLTTPPKTAGVTLLGGTE